MLRLARWGIIIIIIITIVIIVIIVIAFIIIIATVIITIIIKLQAFIKKHSQNLHPNHYYLQVLYILKKNVKDLY